MLSYTIVDGHVVLLDNNRTLIEERQHRELIARAIRGERNYLLCANVNAFKRAFCDIVRLCDSMELPYDSWFQQDRGVVRIGDGGIAVYVDGVTRPGGGWDPWR